MMTELPSLYEWQKPFADLYGRKIKLVTKGGRIIRGLLEPPKWVGYSHLVPSRSLFLHTRSGIRMKIPVRNVEDAEVIE